jgi:hypothetical protein
MSRDISSTSVSAQGAKLIIHGLDSQQLSSKVP